MDSELIIAVTAALDPILLFVGLVIGASIPRWQIRLLFGVAIVLVVAVLFGAHNEPWATVGRSIGMLIGISVGDWLRNRMKRAEVR